MLLIAGLGNPQAKHANNRHNIGFMVADALAVAFDFAPFIKKFDGLLSEGRIGEEKTLLLKPQTFMNESGRSLAKAAKFYKLAPQNIIVFYDELDLPPGKLRMRVGGGVAGHNGLKSAKARLGDGFRRARLGIGHPGDKHRVMRHVLGDFKKADSWLKPFIESLVCHAPLLASGEDATYQNRVHLDMQSFFNEAG